MLAAVCPAKLPGMDVDDALTAASVFSSPPFPATLQLPPMRAFTFLRLTDMMMTEASRPLHSIPPVAFHSFCCIQCPMLPPHFCCWRRIPQCGVAPVGLRQPHPASTLTPVSPPLPCCSPCRAGLPADLGKVHANDAAECAALQEQRSLAPRHGLRVRAATVAARPLLAWRAAHLAPRHCNRDLNCG